MADFLCDKTLFQDYLTGHSDARFTIDRVMVGAITASISPQTVMELWLESDFSREDEIKLAALLTFLEEAPFTVEAAKLAGSWLASLPYQDRETNWSEVVISATASQRGEPILTSRGQSFISFYTAVVSY